MSQLMSASQKQIMWIYIISFICLIIFSYAHSLLIETQYYRGLYLPEIVLFLFLFAMASTTGSMIFTIILLFQRKWKTSIIFVTLFFCGIISIAIAHIYDGSSILYAT